MRATLLQGEGALAGRHHCEEHDDEALQPLLAGLECEASRLWQAQA